MTQPPRLDYCNQDLRNRSFKHQDLSGADFGGADIRGCNFIGANLKSANFQRVKTGLSRKQLITEISAAFAFAFTVSVIVLVLANTVAVAVAMALAVGAAFTVAYTDALVGAVTVTSVLTLTVAVAGAGSGAIIVAGAARSAFGSGVILTGIGWSVLSIVLAGCAIYLFRALNQTIHDVPGTIFHSSDLTHVNFDRARIQNADFSDTILDFVNWTDASFAQCRFPASFDRKIRQLCNSRDGRGQDYSHSNLKNLHLAGMTLTSANLARANLNYANLQSSNLERANLQSTQALGTDFSNAVLTGACIQHWGINAATRFDDVRCDYIYLEPDQQERRPASGIFQPGDFAKLVNQFTNTLDFLFRNGIEPQAFDVALRNLLAEYEDAGLSLQAVVDVGDGDRLVKLTVANPTADKAPMHAQFMGDYEAMQKQLEAAREKTQALQQDLARTEGQLIVYREQSVFLQGFVYHQTSQFSRPSFNAPNSHFTGDTMSDKRSKIELNNVTGDISGVAGGDISGVAGKDITGAAGGDISGTLTLTLGQLEATKDPEALKLADLLKQLKTAIEGKDAGLDAKDKEKALKHIDAIAKLGGDRTNPDLLERAGDALDALPTLVKRGNGLLEFSEKYLPTITAGIKTVLAASGIAL